MFSVTTIPCNVTRTLEFIHTSILIDIIPTNLKFDLKDRVLTWDYFSEDCLPRSFYVYLI